MMAILNDERPGPDDRTSLRVHRCDICGRIEKTPLVRHAANPKDWYKIEVRRGSSIVLAHADLCDACWNTGPYRAQAMYTLAAKCRDALGIGLPESESE